MSLADNEPLKEIILTHLKRSANKDDLIYEICEKYGCDWAEVEELVDTVEITNYKKISKHQGWWLLAVSIFGFLLGIVLAFLFYKLYISPLLLRANEINSLEAILLSTDLFNSISLLMGAVSFTVGGMIGIVDITKTLME